MAYTIILKDKSAFMADWYTYENFWSEDCMICVIDNVRDKISFEVYGEYNNSIICFQTEEMRDAFKENFMDLIEQCKELL